MRTRSVEDECVEQGWSGVVVGWRCAQWIGIEEWRTGRTEKDVEGKRGDERQSTQRAANTTVA
jgi:hypothetical protein